MSRRAWTFLRFNTLSQHDDELGAHHRVEEWSAVRATPHRKHNLSDDSEDS